MTIDIFQWSNMYTLRKSIQWLADEIHVKEECGPYVTKPGEHHSGCCSKYNPWLGHNIPDWPKLLHLYSRLKPGKTVYEWREEYEVEGIGVDVRRFTSFGVIKGFLRRVHRWPVYLLSPASPVHKSKNKTAPTDNTASFDMNNLLSRKRGHSLNNAAPLRFPFTTAQTGELATNTQTYRVVRPTAGTSSVTFPSSEHSLHGMAFPNDAFYHNHAQLPPTSTSVYRARRASVAEKVLEQLRNRDKAAAQQQQLAAGYTSPRTSWIPFQNRDSNLFSHSVEPSSSSSPHNHLQAGGGPDTSGSVTPTHTVDGLLTPTATTKSHYSLAATGACAGTGAVMGIGPGAALVSGLQFPPPQGSPSRPTSMLGSGGVSNAGIVRHTENRQSLINIAPPPSPVLPKATLTMPSRPKMSRSPSAQQVGQIQGIAPGGSYGQGTSMSQGSASQSGQGRLAASSGLQYPSELIQLLDGEHHSDELCTRFEVGWPLLERWLQLIGGGEIGSEEAKVVVIFR